MQQLSSRLTSTQVAYIQAQEGLDDLGFNLGGNWDYKNGSLDRALDKEHKVWLRLPFEVERGELDVEAEKTDAIIRFGQPYVLRHEYEEGLDQDAQPRTLGGFFDQFAAPSNPDAAIDESWISEAKRVLEQAEKRFVN
ncbi:YugN-like family protein [Cohnella ginsengisoli]|uniref:YugN-like family protein n=1 Tax=Cohnella ginsengisoli TaxID=425004 RepID=A0A9X4KDX9_9BACL|nr:YugN family protein [Cohnella ginsengisoli]MDG0790364.1 YugN-like family protein [Cohnella ginsengisoli]